ncbi:hypothetical protein M9Y10_022518 [Tritrichomonas musculus]|uniref:Uncharacterized protein n=1 Tax=Tritrichomonas musculus TaxID=1915356 RepID=A0ABR2KSU4_9EUKA
MEAKVLNEHFDLLVDSINALFDETSLKFNIILKLRNEFNQIINEIRPSLSNSSRISSIPFERNMSQLASLCQRVYFASHKNPKDPKSICLFFSDLHYPIDLSDQYLDDELDDDDDEDNIIYLNFAHNEIFTSKI